MFLTSAELCLTVVSKDQDGASVDAQCDKCHHVAQREAVRYKDEEQEINLAIAYLSLWLSKK